VDEPVVEDWNRAWVLRGTLDERRALGMEERAIGLAAYMMKIEFGDEEKEIVRNLRSLVIL
jgi:hypothetical protein